MSTHAVARDTPTRAGWCEYLWQWEDVDIRCTSPAIPGGTECAAHLIERVHRDEVQQ